MSWTADLARLDRLAREIEDTQATELVAHAVRACAQERCSVAFLGEWSRGKSSLVNALVGRALIPVDVRPTTAAVVSLCHGALEQATVVGSDGRIDSLPVGEAALRRAQTHESGGTATADRVELTLNEPNLVGFRLIDTPGVNDLSLTAEDVVYRLLPQVDLAVVVLDASNGGMSRTEHEFLGADVLGPLAPPLAFVVTHMDRVDTDDEEELAELREEFAQAVRGVAGPGAPVLFGSLAGAAPAEALAEQLWSLARAAATSSVERRRDRTVSLLQMELLALVDARLETAALRSVELDHQVAVLDNAGRHIVPALRDFRAHVHAAGADRLKDLVSRSLDDHAQRTRADLVRRIAMTGDLAAYAQHGLVHDVESASRRWSQHHLPEVSTFLRRHLGFTAHEFRSAFGSVLGPSVSRLRIRMPDPQPLPEVDAALVASKQQDADSARFILPGILTIVGSMIAMPLGVAGLYLGMKIANDRQAQARDVIRSDLTAAAEELVRHDARRAAQDLHRAIDAYFADLDGQLERAFGELLSQRQVELRAARRQREAGGQPLAAWTERLTRVRRDLAEP